MTIRALTCGILLLAVAGLRADEGVRRVQEELRKRNLYFGDVDGRITPETQGAIRRYQERKNFAPTGQLNDDTLRALEIAPTGKPAEQWPEGTVMKSDAARHIAEADRKVLEELNASAVPPPVSAPPVKEPEPAIPAPEPPVKPPEPVASAPEPPAAVLADLTEQTQTFVRDYLAACATNQLDAEMKFYADRMAYFDHGNVGREFVAKDVQRFYKRWPQRQYELLDFKLSKARGEEREFTFRIAFRYKNAEQSVAGRSMNLFKARQSPEGLRLVSLKEQRVRE